MSFITTKFHKILLSGFSGVALTNCFEQYIFNFVQKVALLPEKYWIRISCRYAHLHVKSFITTKFKEILLSGFSGVALTNCFSGIFHFGQVQKPRNSEKKNKSKFPVDMHIYTLCPSLLQMLSGFRGVPLTNCFGSIFHFGQIFKFKRGTIQRKKNWIKTYVDRRIHTICPS